MWTVHLLAFIYSALVSGDAKILVDPLLIQFEVTLFVAAIVKKKKKNQEHLWY